MGKYSTVKKRIIKYSCVVGLISFMLLFLVGCMIFGYMEKEEKSRAAYMAQSTVRRIKAQLERYVVSSDLMENIINAGYQLDEETFSKLASVIPNENDVVKAFEKASGKKIPYVIGPRRDGDIATCYSDPSKALKELGWKAERGIEEMCEDSWRWQSQNPNGYPD